ncbi:MAG: thioredoxin domain-containing protein [Pseudomonadota bacterium]
MKKVFLCIGLLLSADIHAEDWITEEVLKQLSEVRQELKALQQEVKGLKEAIAERPVANSAPTRNSGNVSIDQSPYVGNNEAEIAIIEFSDYQCPYCRRHFTQTFPEISRNYLEPGKVKYVMKQFPLGFHAKARGASIAALCVEQEKPGEYWRAHESIFSGNTKLNQESYLEMASSLGIQSAKFQACMADPKIASLVDQDLREGEGVGVSGTPAFYIGKIKDGKVVGGRLVSGARPYSTFENLLESLL